MRSGEQHPPPFNAELSHSQATGERLVNGPAPRPAGHTETTISGDTPYSAGHERPPALGATL
jgi:hypothetical protein